MAQPKQPQTADLLSLSLSAELQEMLGKGAQTLVAVAVVRDGRIDVGVTTQQFPTCDLPQASDQIATLLKGIHRQDCQAAEGARPCGS